MDERLEKALEFSKYRVSLFNQKENIKLKMETMLLYGFNRGVFKAAPDLISFIKTMVDLGKETMVLIDNNGNPIEIPDLNAFNDELIGRYIEATNFYHIEYNKLTKARNIKDQFSDLFKE